MARAWNKALFFSGDMFPGANDSTRRSLGMLNRDNQAVERILAAAKLLKIKATAPYWREDCWAHVGFPNLGIAIIVRSFGDLAMCERFKEKWGRHKFKFLMVLERHLERQTVEGVAGQLQEAIDHLGKVGVR